MDFNATNSTPNYGLPIFIATDKPSWLVDWNGAMTELDTVIKEISTSEEANKNLIATANANIAKINNIIEEIQAYNTALTNRVVTLEGKTNKLESEYNTVINDLQAPIEGGLSSLTNMVNKNTDDIQQNSRAIDLTTSRLSNLEQDVQPLKTRANVVHCLNESGILPATVKDLTEDYALKNISQQNLIRWLLVIAVLEIQKR